MTVQVFGLVCPQCGESLEPAGVTYVSVSVSQDGALEYDLHGVAGHRCGAALRARLDAMGDGDGDGDD